MATPADVQQALLDAMHEMAPNPTAHSQRLLRYAEAYAWLVYPGQPHGGSTEVKS